MTKTTGVPFVNRTIRPWQFGTVTVASGSPLSGNLTAFIFLLFPLNLSTQGRKQKRAATLFLQQKTNKQIYISWRSKCCTARKPLPVTDGYWRQNLYMTESEQDIKYPYWKVHMLCPVQDVFLPGSLCGFSHCLIRRLLFINI